jgi:hypothetical protein
MDGPNELEVVREVGYFGTCRSWSLGSNIWKSSVFTRYFRNMPHPANGVRIRFGGWALSVELPSGAFSQK